MWTALFPMSCPRSRWPFTTLALGRHKVNFFSLPRSRGFPVVKLSEYHSLARSLARVTVEAHATRTPSVHLRKELSTPPIAGEGVMSQVVKEQSACLPGTNIKAVSELLSPCGGGRARPMSYRKCCGGGD